jgi:hypothetical protein
VYFSTPGLGGNKIGAYNGLGTKTPALGTVVVDLSHICNMIDGTSGSSCSGAYEDSRPEFGILTPCLGTTVGQMLTLSNQVMCSDPNWPLVLIAPLSHILQPKALPDIVVPCTYKNGLPKPSRIILSQIQPLQKTDLQERIGEVRPVEVGRNRQIYFLAH